MSVHSTHYDDPDEYERDLRWEYRKGNEEDKIPFYGCPTDEYMEREENQHESDII